SQTFFRSPSHYRLPITDYLLPNNKYFGFPRHFFVHPPITDYRLPITYYPIISILVFPDIFSFTLPLPITDYRLPITSLHKFLKFFL
ncbi:MAG: hypothetical protein QNJ47_16795, partial [Nostocaceae cyanobacterium]|nr:hypothetical protein [Nostocaceae cyanobacterium]